MNKTELIPKIAQKAEISKKDADVFFNAVLETIAEELENGNKIQIVGFGTFEVKERAERLGRDPRTNEVITIPASKAPVFKASKVLKARCK